MRAVFLLVFAGCAVAPSTPPAADTPDASAAAPVAPETSAAAAAPDWTASLALVDARIAFLQKQADAAPTQWLPLDRLASVWQQRARLTGSYDDYGQAEVLLERAFSLAKEGSGPWRTRAGLNYTVHRLDAAESDLDRYAGRLLLDQNAHADIERFRADIAWQRGQHDAARAGWKASLGLHASVAPLAGLAALAWHTGDFDAADALWAQVEADTPLGEPTAWLHLQRGLMDLDRGRLDDAWADYTKADAAFPGYWLVQEHQAEILTLQGRADEALPRYEDLVTRTGNPELMDAVAGILRARGDTDGARTWIARADEAYAVQIARFPEAAAGHALRHYLAFGADPQQALRLAEANARLRPNGEARTLLAEARLAAGDVPGAREAIDGALGLGWRSAETYSTAAHIAVAEGNAAAAATAWEAARVINPSAGPG